MCTTSIVISIIITIIITSIYFNLKQFWLKKQIEWYKKAIKELAKDSIEDEIKYQKHLWLVCSSASSGNKWMIKSIIKNYFNK
jgi:hypothetical protein